MQHRFDSLVRWGFSLPPPNLIIRFKIWQVLYILLFSLGISSFTGWTFLLCSNKNNPKKLKTWIKKRKYSRFLYTSIIHYVFLCFPIVANHLLYPYHFSRYLSPFSLRIPSSLPKDKFLDFFFSWPTLHLYICFTICYSISLHNQTITNSSLNTDCSLSDCSFLYSVHIHSASIHS